MKRRTIRAGMAPVSGPLRRILPLLLQTLLVVALALPAGFAVAPAFLGPQAPANAAQAAPAWHQVPGTLAAGGGADGSKSDGIEPLTAAAPVPEPGSLAAQLNETLKVDGAGSFTGVVQDAVTGEVLFDRSGDTVRVPASNMKLLTAAAALRTLGPERRFSTTAVAGAAPGSVVLTGGGDVLLGAGESVPGAVLGRAGLASLAQATVRALQDDGVSVPADGAAGRFPLHRPRAEPGLEPGGRCRRRGGSAVPAGTELGPLRPGQDHRPAPAGRRDERRRGVFRPARGAAAAAGLTVAPGVVRVPAGNGRRTALPGSWPRSSPPP